jgi:hypothetical protein
MSISTFVAMLLLVFVWLESRASAPKIAPKAVPTLQAEEFQPLDP